MYHAMKINGRNFTIMLGKIITISWKSLFYVPLIILILLIATSCQEESQTWNQTSSPVDIEEKATPEFIVTKPYSDKITSTDIPSNLQPLVFELLGTPAAYKETGYHSALWDLQLWHDRIYLAHGDWHTNSGPLRLIYLDLMTGAFVHDNEFILDEDGMEHIRLYGDTMYIPGTDASESWDFGNLYIMKWGESWIKLRTIPNAVHVWDIALLDELIVAIGQKGSDGALWISSDGGRTWGNGPDFQAEGYAMPMSGFVLENKIYVTTVGTGCLVYDGRFWRTSDCLKSNIFEGTAAVQKNAVFHGVVTMAPYWSTLDNQIHFFDGEERWTVKFPEPIHDVITADKSLFVLAGDPSGKGAIYSAQDLDCRCEQDFNRIVYLDFQDEEMPPKNDEFLRPTLGSTPHSIEFANGQFYIGLADGRLYRSTP
jgi:hypothetical protein